MLPLHEPTYAAASLQKMLDRREARCASQQSLLRRWGGTLVQLTLVQPGPVKDTVQARFVFETGLATIRQTLAEAGQTVLAQEGGYWVTGPEILMVLDAQPLPIKQMMLQIEEHHPIGRLWDVDVLDAAGKSVSRQQLGFSARLCLLCDEPAHACARSGAHTLPELQRAVKDKVDGYRNRLA